MYISELSKATSTLPWDWVRITAAPLTHFTVITANNQTLPNISREHFYLFIAVKSQCTLYRHRNREQTIRNRAYRSHGPECGVVFFRSNDFKTYISNSRPCCLRFNHPPSYIDWSGNPHQKLCFHYLLYHRLFIMTMMYYL
jgi:hypothetical protein